MNRKMIFWLKHYQKKKKYIQFRRHLIYFKPTPNKLSQRTTTTLA